MECTITKEQSTYRDILWGFICVLSRTECSPDFQVMYPAGIPVRGSVCVCFHSEAVCNFMRPLGPVSNSILVHFCRPMSTKTKHLSSPISGMPQLCKSTGSSFFLFQSYNKPHCPSQKVGERKKECFLPLSHPSMSLPVAVAGEKNISFFRQSCSSWNKKKTNATSHWRTPGV